MITKMIHQTWKNVITPEKMNFCIESWKIKNLNYEYIFWTDNDIHNFISKNYPQYLNLLNNVKFGIQKADIFRIIALYHYGGIYVDIDFECLIPIDEWDIDSKKINVSYEPLQHHKKNVLCNALIYSPPKMECLLKILDHGSDIIQSKPSEVMTSFGPLAWQEVLGNSNDISIIETIKVYPLPDITINKSLEDEFRYQISNKDFGDSWAVHYWEHSNWPRTNILSNYNENLSPNNKLSSINICCMFRNNELYLKDYFVPKMNLLKKLYPHIDFYFYIYENDSTDNTKQILINFMKINKGNIITEDLGNKSFSRGTSFERIQNICNCRNKHLSMRPFLGDWSVFIDSDIEFPNNIIERFICKKLPEDLVGLTCNGVDHLKCRVLKNKNHYFDTLAFIDIKNNSAFLKFIKKGPNSCPFTEKEDIKKWDDGKLIKTQSSFGGMAFYKTSIINNSDIKYKVEYIDKTKYCCEHFGFNKILLKHGNLYSDPTFIVRNVEN